MSDAINPTHYKNTPPNTDIVGECIDYSEKLGFCLGNAFKYIWRAGLKGPFEEDLNKGLWYMSRFLAQPDPYPTLFTHLMYRQGYNSNTLITPRAYCLEMLCTGTPRSVGSASVIVTQALEIPEARARFDVRVVA